MRRAIGMLAKYTNLMNATDLSTVFSRVLNKDSNHLSFPFIETFDFNEVKPGLIAPYYSMCPNNFNRHTGAFFLLLADMFKRPLEPLMPLAIALEMLPQVLSLVDDMGESTLKGTKAPDLTQCLENSVFLTSTTHMIVDFNRIVNSLDFPESTKYLMMNDYTQYYQELVRSSIAELEMLEQKQYAPFKKCSSADKRKTAATRQLLAEHALRTCTVTDEIRKALIDLMSEIAFCFQMHNHINSIEAESNYKDKSTGQAGNDYLNENAIIAQDSENLYEKASRVREILQLPERTQAHVDELLQIIKECKGIETIKEYLENAINERWDVLDKLLSDSEPKTNL